MEKIIALYKKYREIIVYLIVGVLTTLVSWAAYAVCTLVMNVDNPVQMQAAVIIRWVAGVVFAYFTNRAFVFRSKNPNMLREALSFASSRLVTLVLDMLIMWLLPSIFGVDDWVATFVSAVLVTITNYIFSKFLVFRRKAGSGRETEETHEVKGCKKKDDHAVKKEELPNLKKEFTVGISAFIVNTIVLALGVYVFSLLYKAGARNAQEIAAYWPDDVSSQTFFVRPAAGAAGILLLFLLKNWYDVRFYHIQLQARNDRARARRVLEWGLYVLVMGLMTVLIFFCFSCGKDFFDDYTFESAGLGNAAYSLLYFVTPLLYVIHALIRLVLKKAGIQTGAEKPKTRAQRRREEREAAKRR